MKRTFSLFLGAALLPMALGAQEIPTDRLQNVLPPEVSSQVLEQIEDARARGLPAQAMATLALEGVTKGRSGEEIVAAVEGLATDMTQATEALERAGDREPQGGEVEAATAAMRMGVDGEAVGELARSQPSGRSLAVPLLVVGGLVDRGLPSDEALASVRDRLEAGATDGQLLADFPEVGRSLGQGMAPAERGAAMRSGFAGVQVPVAGVPVSIPGRPGIGRRPGGL